MTAEQLHEAIMLRLAKERELSPSIEAYYENENDAILEVLKAFMK